MCMCVLCTYLDVSVSQPLCVEVWGQPCIMLIQVLNSDCYAWQQVPFLLSYLPYHKNEIFRNKNKTTDLLKDMECFSNVSIWHREDRVGFCLTTTT